MEATGPYQSIRPIYLDHNATTPLHPKVLEALPELAKGWGNPSSIHWGGREPKNILRDTRKKLSQILNCSPLELIFTSGGSESNNQILKGVFEKNQSNKLKSNRVQVLVGAVDHPSIMKTAAYLQTLGADVQFIPVKKEGTIDMVAYSNLLSEKTLLVSCMLANNETGAIFPIQEMVHKAHAVGALFHSDCVQAFGKIQVDLKNLDVDFATFSAHKVYSLKGLGFHFARKGQNLEPLIHGGGQERHRRGGTENTLSIGALGIICDLFSELILQQNFLEKIRDEFELIVTERLSGVSISNEETLRLKNTSHLTIAGVDGETLLMSLDLLGYAVSTGAACSSGNPEPSPALLAMGFTREEAQHSLRVSFGYFSDRDMMLNFVDSLVEVVHRLRRLSSESQLTISGGHQ